MAINACPRETETIRTAWQDADAGTHGGTSMAPDLAAHVAECRSCAQIFELAAALREERDATLATARPPAAGAVWWRAERRAREEAARKAASPISFVHAIALGCAAAALVAVLGLGLGPVRGYFAEWWRPLAWAAPPAGGLMGALSALPIGVLLLMAATLLLAPVALYLALSE